MVTREDFQQPVNDALARLGNNATCTTEQLAAVTGMDKHALWRAARMEQAPFPFVRVGRQIRWLTGPAIAILSGAATSDSQSA